MNWVRSLKSWSILNPCLQSMLPQATSGRFETSNSQRSPGALGRSEPFAAVGVSHRRVTTRRSRSPTTASGQTNGLATRATVSPHGAAVAISIRIPTANRQEATKVQVLSSDLLVAFGLVRSLSAANRDVHGLALCCSNQPATYSILVMWWLGRLRMPCGSSGTRTNTDSILRSFNAS
jgi:hypothetical protein